MSYMEEGRVKNCDIRSEIQLDGVEKCFFAKKIP